MFGLFKNDLKEYMDDTKKLIDDLVKGAKAQDEVNKSFREILDNHAKIINGLSHNQQLLIVKIEELEAKDTVKKVTKKVTKKTTKKKK